MPADHVIRDTVAFGLAVAAGLSAAEKGELAREISLCFRYYTVTFRGRHVDRVIFAGGEAYENILLNVLRRQLAVDVEVAQPLRGFDMTSRELFIVNLLSGSKIVRFGPLERNCLVFY